MTENIDDLAARYGFPKPITTAFTPAPQIAAQIAAQIDLDETFERTACCCALHGSLHDRRTCCPEHRQERAGIAVPTMTPLVSEAAYDTGMDPCSPDFDLSTWL